MIAMQNRLCPNRDEIAFKVIGGEAIIMNISRGVCYSLYNVGAVIWEMIEGEYTLDDCVKAILEHYDVPLGQAQTDARVLAEELLQERLVIISENDAHHKYNPQSPNKPQLSYETPKLNIYRDIGELLALDPPIPGLKKIDWED